MSPTTPVQPGDVIRFIGKPRKRFLVKALIDNGLETAVECYLLEGYEAGAQHTFMLADITVDPRATRERQAWVAKARR